MKICPYCEQDSVWKVRLHPPAEFTFAMCFECDSVWVQGDLISDQTGTNFADLMSSVGQVADWSKVEKIALVE